MSRGRASRREFLAALRLSPGLVALTLVACGPWDPGLPGALHALDTILATCAQKGGELEVRRAGAGFWEPAALASTFHAGDWVRAGAPAGSRLEFVAGARLELAPGAVVILDEASVGREPLVAVQAGGVRGTISSGPGQAGALHVRDASGQAVRVSAGAGGTAEVGLSRLGGATELRVAGGEAILTSASGEQRASAGAALDLVAGGLRQIRLLPYPASVLPAPDARVQASRTPAITLRWKPVVGATSYLVEVAGDLRFEPCEQATDVAGTELTLTPSRRGMFAWRVAARDADGRLGEWGFARRIWLD